MFFVLFVLYLLFSGSFAPKNMLVAAAVALLITLFSAKFMGYRPKKAGVFLRRLPHALRYFALLLKEIVCSNFAVLRLLWRGKEPEPLLVRFRSPLRHEGAEVLVAESITLTPGTITVDLGDGTYLVHALDASLAEGIEDCGFFRAAKRWEDA